MGHVALCQVHWASATGGTNLNNQALFSQQIGTGGQSCVYDSCRAWLGLSFEPLTANGRSKLDSVGDVACCSGAFTSAPDGT